MLPVDSASFDSIIQQLSFNYSSMKLPNADSVTNWTELNDIDGQYKRFRKLLMNNRELSSFIPSGSIFEIPAEYFISNPTDIDFMVCSKAAFTSPPSRSHLKQEFKEDPLLIDTQDCHVGFSRLRKMHNISEYYRKPFSVEFPETKGPAWEKIISAKLTQLIFGPLDQRWEKVSEIKMDRVYAVHCPVWPDVAKEWLIRDRKNSWPPPKVIDEIVKLGCHLVAKPHQSNPNDDTQWRFSFSQAELILINSWTDVQKYIYHVLRLIKSEVVRACGGEESTVLCTYFFKTLMFWACEEKPKEFWEENNLETSIGELLCTMIEWLIEKHCPNYFIRDNNMIDHLSDEVDLSKEISCLLHFSESSIISDILSKIPKAYTKNPLRITLPRKLIVFGLLSISTQHINFNLSQAWSLKNTSRLDSDHLVPELRFLYHGIRKHKSIVELKCASLSSRNGRDVDGEKQLEFEAKKYFKLAMNARDNECCSTLLNFNLSLGKNLQHIFSLVDDTCTEYRQDKDNNRECPVSESSGFCPLMKIATSLFPAPGFLISTAYYVNFLYTVKRDYKSAAEQVKRCTEYLKILDSVSPVNTNGFKDAFSVLLTNEWSELFDEHIQNILGLLTLYSALSRSRCGPQRSRKIIVEISPLAFLEYIYFQSVRKHNEHDHTHEQEPIDFKCDFGKTSKALFYGIQMRDNVSRIFLFYAICASGIRRNKTGETTYSVQWPECKLHG